MADGSLPGKRLAADGLFLFGVKKEPKNRHRFDAVDADQGVNTLDPCAATPPGRPTQALGGLSKEGI